MQLFRFLMNKRERSRADARMGETLSLRARLADMSHRDKMELLEQRKYAARFLCRQSLADTVALACLAAMCIGVAFPSAIGLAMTTRVQLLVLTLLAFPTYRLVHVMDTSQRAYCGVRAEIEAILDSGMPEASRFDNW